MDPAVPPSDGVCHLLRLAAELRNMIWDYALYALLWVVCRIGDPIEDLIDYQKLLYHFFDIEIDHSDTTKANKYNGTYYAPSVKLDAQPTKVAATEINQLRYACRQSCHETLGTVLHRNELVSKGGLPDLFDFFHVCPASRSSELRVVTVLQSRDYSDNVFCERDERERMRSFCQQYPKLIVQLRHSWLDLCAEDIFQRVVEFAVNFRKNACIAYRISTRHAAT
jgi:hypothetical protein